MECAESLLRLLQNEKKLPSELRLMIGKKVKHLVDDLTLCAGKFLHEDLDDEKHSEEEVRTLVQCIPLSLLVRDEYRWYPIQKAAWKCDTIDDDCYNMKAIPFIPLLAEEGVKLRSIMTRDRIPNIAFGGGDSRGGLLNNFYDLGDINVISQLASVSPWVDEDASLCCLDVIKKLRGMNLIKKGDIKDYDLLWLSYHNNNPERFHYFANWDPNSLKTPRGCSGQSIIHLCAESHQVAQSKMVLSASLRHFPHKVGLLFHKNRWGETPFNLAIRRNGIGATWKVVEDCFEEADGAKLFGKHSKEGIYPLMHAAKGKTSELDVVYYLLRQNPIVLETTTKAEVIEPRKRKR